MAMQWVLWVCVVCAEPAVESAPPVQWTTPLKVETGEIRGVLVGEKGDVEAYKGIPYAATPTGSLRWKAPQKAESWTGVRDCPSFGSACPQRTPQLMKAVPQMAINAPYNEDCLYLNVWRPAEHKSEKLPVLVWIHGGGYTMGAASQPIYDGEHLARHGAIIVTINYRLGPMGFFAHPKLSEESPQHVSGNYGLLDQIESLKWVQRNIAVFGGDPSRVTIFGESAGGGSVLCLLASPLAKGLFHAAVAQSAPEMNLMHLKEKRRDGISAEEQGKKLMVECGAGESASLEELRAIPAQKLVDVFPSLEVNRPELVLVGVSLPVGPVVDGYAIPDEVNQIFARGEENRVPLIIGANRDEASMFMMMTKLPKDIAGYAAQVRKDFGADEPLIATAYPVAEAKAIRSTIMRLVGDMIFVSQARHAARMHSANGNKTYLYHFTHGSKSGILATMGAHHAAEVQFVFAAPQEKWGNVDHKLADTMADYWVQFAATGNPNGGDRPQWPTYDAKTDQWLEIGAEIKPVAELRKEQLDAIDKYREVKRNRQNAPQGN